MPNQNRDIFSVMSILSENSDKNFVQRIMNHAKAPRLYDNAGGELGSPSTHSMAADVDQDGNWFVYPTVVQRPDGNLQRLSRNEAWQFAGETGERIAFGKNKDRAVWFSRPEGYKQIWGNQ